MTKTNYCCSIEKSVVEIKNEYTNYLINILVPYFYSSILFLYNNSIKKHEEIKKTAQGKNIDMKDYTVDILFKKMLKNLLTLNGNQVEKEHTRIKQKTETFEFFDDLVKAVIKSHVQMLTFNGARNEDSILFNKQHETINIPNFIHKCYINIGKYFYIRTYLFSHNHNTSDLLKARMIIDTTITTAIKDSIRETLQMNEILKEYLNNEMLYEHTNNQDKKENLKNNVEEYLDNENYTENTEHSPPKNDEQEEIDRQFLKGLGMNRNIDNVTKKDFIGDKILTGGKINDSAQHVNDQEVKKSQNTEHKKEDFYETFA